jgi:DNA-binding winged helix-turn-helix (wHTH) protein
LAPVEPQVFALLRLLIENRERVVSKDEIIERIWDGRIVSESAVSSRVKSARQAIGDSGEAQRLIRTVHKLGFRFVAEVV